MRTEPESVSTDRVQIKQLTTGPDVIIVHRKPIDDRDVQTIFVSEAICCSFYKLYFWPFMPLLDWTVQTEKPGQREGKRDQQRTSRQKSNSAHQRSSCAICWSAAHDAKRSKHRVDFWSK